ncbi:MAG: M20 family metallopeptidase [Halobacteriota archaeon]
MTELADLVIDLVSTPSHDDETAAGDRIEAWLRAETDATVTRDEAGNVIARRSPPGGADRSLALVGHHDVVPPAPEQLDGDAYVVETSEGRIYGRGTADMKGAVAASMLAFRDADPSVELVFASFVGEEVGGTGARAAIDEGFAPDYAIVAEGSTNYSGPGVTDVVVAHRGRRASRLVASGTASHASEPAAGENAIYRACDAIDVVRQLEVPSASVFGEEIAGSVVVTEIDGGTAWNVVPDTASVTIDERTVPDERAALELTAAIDGVEWIVEQDLPPMACDDEPFAEAVLAAAIDAQEGTPELVTKPHATDAGWLVQNGTTCVVCGASEPGEAHTKTESVSIDVLERCYRIYRGVAERL